MNRTYIKRQLTLNKLGLSISEDVQDYVDLFNELIGNPNILVKKYGKHLGEYGYYYSKYDKNIAFHVKERNAFWVDYNLIWIEFINIYRNSYYDTSILLSLLLENYFNCEVGITSHTYLNL